MCENCKIIKHEASIRVLDYVFMCFIIVSFSFSCFVFLSKPTMKDIDKIYKETKSDLMIIRSMLKNTEDEVQREKVIKELEIKKLKRIYDELLKGE